MPVLYETLIFQSSDFRLDHPSNLHKILLHSKNRLVHVRGIVFEAPFRENLTQRCLHYDDPRPEWDEDWETDLGRSLIHFGRNIMLLMDCLSDNSLREFRWVVICFRNPRAER